ncbi:uncharacterized protein LOC130252861 [Oenanthe melanoleuca]|uniref:uncharacterized protein LOC130252861 n=1 Tax=Oenanthe melanoleuca TaxID=2939378 RepID=UPI0024C1BA9C|nr:uncharacterized protein LOC130252861 [Oenanthe melanoleuca]
MLGSGALQELQELLAQAEGLTASWSRPALPPASCRDPAPSPPGLLRKEGDPRGPSLGRDWSPELQRRLCWDGAVTLAPRAVQGEGLGLHPLGSLGWGGAAAVAVQHREGLRAREPRTGTSTGRAEPEGCSSGTDRSQAAPVGLAQGRASSQLGLEPLGSVPSGLAATQGSLSQAGGAPGTRGSEDSSSGDSLSASVRELLGEPQSSQQQGSAPGALQSILPRAGAARTRVGSTIRAARTRAGSGSSGDSLSARVRELLEEPQSSQQQGSASLESILPKGGAARTQVGSTAARTWAGNSSSSGDSLSARVRELLEEPQSCQQQGSVSLQSILPKAGAARTWAGSRAGAARTQVGSTAARTWAGNSSSSGDSLSARVRELLEKPQSCQQQGSVSLQSILPRGGAARTWAGSKAGAARTWAGSRAGAARTWAGITAGAARTWAGSRAGAARTQAGSGSSSSSSSSSSGDPLAARVRGLLGTAPPGIDPRQMLRSAEEQERKIRAWVKLKLSQESGAGWGEESQPRMGAEAELLPRARTPARGQDLWLCGLGAAPEYLRKEEQEQQLEQQLEPFQAARDRHRQLSRAQEPFQPSSPAAAPASPGAEPWDCSLLQELQLEPWSNAGLQEMKSLSAAELQDLKLHPRNIAGLQLDPRNTSELQLDPKNSAGLQLEPWSSAGLQLKPWNTSELQLEPKNSAELQLKPKNSAELQELKSLSAAELQELQLDPKNSAELQLEPRSSAGLQLDPKNSAGLQLEPRSSAGLQVCQQQPSLGLPSAMAGLSAPLHAPRAQGELGKPSSSMSPLVPPAPSPGEAAGEGRLGSEPWARLQGCAPGPGQAPAAPARAGAAQEPGQGQSLSAGQPGLGCGGTEQPGFGSGGVQNSLGL